MPEDTLALPAELQELLQDTPELAVLWDDDLMVMKRQSKKKAAQPTSPQERIARFLALIDKKQGNRQGEEGASQGLRLS